MTAYPTYDDVAAKAAERGFEIDAFYPCSIQGVLISYSRPVRDGETFMGLKVAGARVESEIIERHYCPESEASDEVQAVTVGRACQRVIWEMESGDA